VQAGKLRQRVTIETPLQVQNDLGEVYNTWSTFATVWASVEPVKAVDKTTNEQVRNDLDAVIKIRYRSDINSSMRVKHVEKTGSPDITRYYEIVGVINPYSDRREIHLHCVSLGADGFRRG